LGKSTVFAQSVRITVSEKSFNNLGRRIIMALKPLILEMGTGIDLHGQNATEAARRAVWNAVHQSSIMGLGLFGPDTSKNMVVEVTIAITRPDEVDEDVVLAVLPHGTGKLKVIQGGMEIEGREGSGDFTLIANAAVIAKLDL
tara:strand:+ start:187 stop:615 length:429 start_codon:yes stop_codon:yes gene_type:complete